MDVKIPSFCHYTNEGSHQGKYDTFLIGMSLDEFPTCTCGNTTSCDESLEEVRISIFSFWPKETRENNNYQIHIHDCNCV